jgi:hypothetical protein
MLHRSIRKPFQINALNLVGKIGSPSSFGENPPIRREKALPFRPRTIKVSGEKPYPSGEPHLPFHVKPLSSVLMDDLKVAHKHGGDDGA